MESNKYKTRTSSLSAKEYPAVALLSILLVVPGLIAYKHFKDKHKDEVENEKLELDKTKNAIKNIAVKTKGKSTSKGIRVGNKAKSSRNFAKKLLEQRRGKTTRSP